ncbi:DNA-binding protein [Thorsellia kenyensis]|uniref:DNA-binding protein n=1 Tax=Thorsellia kenyensis TaxID=1549888 RepID=A0ABV6C7N7_9GAMM
MYSIKDAILEVGIHNVANACGVTTRAVYKWISNNYLPKTEFFGGTNYAQKIESLSNGKFKAENLLEQSKQTLLKETN